MKKSIYIVIFICVVFFSSCTRLPIIQKDDGIYNSFIVGYANDGIITKTEKSWWSGQYENKSTVEKEKSVFFQGINYQAEYKKSTLASSRHNMTDIYYNTETGVEIYFSGNRFAGIHFGHLLLDYDDYNAKDNIIDESKALEMAKTVVQQYIDINEYKIEISENNVLGMPETYLYRVSFIKEKGGFETSDEAIVSITSKGDIRTLSLYDIGIFDDINVPIVDASKLQESIQTKIDKIYEKMQTHEILSIKKQFLSLSPEKDVVLVSEIEVKIDDSTNTSVVLVTYVN